MTNQMIIMTGNAIMRGIHIEAIIKEGDTREGWSSLVLAIKVEAESGVEDIDAFHENTIVVQVVYHGILQSAAEGEKDILKTMMVHMMEDINLLKGKLGIGMVKEIARAKKVEAEKNKEVEDRKRKNADKVKAEKCEKVQKKEEIKRKSAEELAAAEETK